jgi:hypothetical protein
VAGPGSGDRALLIVDTNGDGLPEEAWCNGDASPLAHGIVGECLHQPEPDRQPRLQRRDHHRHLGREHHRQQRGLFAPRQPGADVHRRGVEEDWIDVSTVERLHGRLKPIENHVDWVPLLPFTLHPTEETGGVPIVIEEEVNLTTGVWTYPILIHPRANWGGTTGAIDARYPYSNAAHSGGCPASECVAALTGSHAVEAITLPHWFQ